MDLKNLLLVFALVIQVRSDCDDYFKCLKGFVGDFFGVNAGRNESDINIDNTTDMLDFETIRNKSVNVFDLSDIGRSLSEALTDVTTLIKDEIKGLFNIDDQIDVHKDIENRTEIHVRAFGLSRINGNSTDSISANGTNTINKIPEAIINNLTKFNDELNALKVEIERNLQAELESFISQVLENDTVDWIELTENTLTETEFGTTEKPYPDFENYIETTTLVIDNIVDDVNVIVTDGPINVKNSSKSHSQSYIKDTKSIKNTTNTNITTETTVIIKTTDLPKTISSVSMTTLPLRISVNPEVNSILDNKENITDVRIATNSVVTTTTTTKIYDIITSTTKSPVTTKTTNKELAKKPKKTEISKKQETQTKAPINFKLLDNIKDNEISHEDPSYYEIQDDNNTDYPIIDYVELYKDTTNEDVSYIPTVIPEINDKSDLDNVILNAGVFHTDNAYYTNDTTHPSSIVPWTAAIFIKNSTNNQFDYYCDGTLISNNVVLTTARCVQQLNVTVNAEDVIVFLGKRSLQTSGDGESIHRVKQLTLHPNFSLQGDVALNDLAVLHLEQPAEFSDLIQPACLSEEEVQAQEAVTTSWAESLSLIRFEEQNKTCERNPVENTFCATFGLSVALCPNFGGAYASKQSERWCLSGIRSADPSTRGLCFDKTVAYTDLRAHRSWLDDVMK